MNNISSFQSSSISGNVTDSGSGIFSSKNPAGFYPLENKQISSAPFEEVRLSDEAAKKMTSPEDNVMEVFGPAGSKQGGKTKQRSGVGNLVKDTLKAKDLKFERIEPAKIPKLYQSYGNKPGSVDDIADMDTRDRLTARPEYVALLDQRHTNAVPAVKAIYDKYEKDIKVSNAETGNTARYNPVGKEITVNATEDMAYNPKPGDVYFHEVGHLMDNRFGSKNAAAEALRNGNAGNVSTDYVYASNNEKFKTALRTDFDNYVNKYMEDNNIENRDDAYSRIGREKISHYNYKSISDIYGGLSDKKCQGYWGHSRDYWNSASESFDPVSCEAFAHMFSASMGGGKQIEVMREMLPTAYDEFLQMADKEASISPAYEKILTSPPSIPESLKVHAGSKK